MADIRDLPVMTEADAKALGFAGFNDVPHKVIDLPDTAFTISVKTSDGRRATFCFRTTVTARPASSTSSFTIAAARSRTAMVVSRRRSTASASHRAAGTSSTRAH